MILRSLIKKNKLTSYLFQEYKTHLNILFRKHSFVCGFYSFTIKVAEVQHEAESHDPAFSAAESD